jgi:hypothetical protein
MAKKVHLNSTERTEKLKKILDDPKERRLFEENSVNGLIRDLANAAKVSTGSVSKELKRRGLHIDRKTGKIEPIEAGKKPA